MGEMNTFNSKVQTRSIYICRGVCHITSNQAQHTQNHRHQIEVVAFPLPLSYPTPLCHPRRHSTPLFLIATIVSIHARSSNPLKGVRSPLISLLTPPRRRLSDGTYIIPTHSPHRTQQPEPAITASSPHQPCTQKIPNRNPTPTPNTPKPPSTQKKKARTHKQPPVAIQQQQQKQ